MVTRPVYLVGLQKPIIPHLKIRVLSWLMNYTNVLWRSPHEVITKRVALVSFQTVPNRMSEWTKMQWIVNSEERCVWPVNRLKTCPPTGYWIPPRTVRKTVVVPNDNNRTIETQSPFEWNGVIGTGAKMAALMSCLGSIAAARDYMVPTAGRHCTSAEHVVWPDRNEGIVTAVNTANG